MALAALVATTVAAAQDWPRVDRDECRCVDRDGKEISDCTCLRTRTSGDLLRGLTFYRDARARLGVTVSTEQEASLDARGARVQSVTRNGPADDAGIEEGDMITGVDGHSLLDALDADTERAFNLDRSVPVQRLLAISGKLDPGQEVEVQYERAGQAHTTTVEARDLPGWTDFGVVGPGWDRQEMADRVRAFGDRMREFRFEAPEGGREFRLYADSTTSPRLRVLTSPNAGVYFFSGTNGLELIELNEGLAGYFGVSAGVLVADVPADSPLGLQPGDVVIAVGDREVDGPDHLRRILRSYDDEPITFRIMRHEREMSVQGRLPGR
jgi:predicted metalloprotease with PDZ domain